jgi:hypothetical protein
LPIDVDFRHCPAQSRAFRALCAKARVTNAWGRGTGKSWFDRTSLYLDIAAWEGVPRASLQGEFSGIRQVLLMPTLKQFKKVHADALESDLAPKGRFGFLRASINKTDWKVSFPGGSWIQVVSAANINDNRGIRCDKLVADECDDIETGDYEAVCLPWFSEPWSLDIRLLSGTPRRGRYGLLWKGFHVWPNGDADHAPVPNHLGFHATYRDCPKIVSAEMVAEAKRSMSPDRFAREWECDFDSGEGLVYPFFDVPFHVRPPPAMFAFHSYIVGVDYGYADPTVFLIIGVAGSGKDTICHVLREYYLLGKSPSELGEVAASIELAYPRAKWYADHSPSITKQIRDQAHVHIVPALKGDVEDEVAFVADSIFIREDEEGNRWSQLYVDPSCRHFIEEMGLYRRRRDPRDNDRVLDAIDTSKNDHGPDALRYALVTHFGGDRRRMSIG